MRELRRLAAAFKEHVADDFQRRRHQLITLLLMLGCISGFMSVVNIITRQYSLLAATALFCVFSLASSWMGHVDKKGTRAASLLFSVEIVALFTYFILTGGTEGFSTIWLLLLPACGLFAFGIKQGSALSALLFVELIFFFHIPFGRELLLCRDYTETFLVRFPFVYLAFWLVGLFLELVREETYRQLAESRENYAFLSNHDTLTALYNRVGFNAEMDRAVAECAQGRKFALLIMDLDFFKNINDTYGHSAGDKVLRSVADTIRACLGTRRAAACRWGGEEFAILLFDEGADDYREIAENLRTAIALAEHEKEHHIRLTVSIGGVRSDELEELSAPKAVLTADEMLYKAKESGRNRTVCPKSGAAV